MSREYQSTQVHSNDNVTNNEDVDPGLSLGTSSPARLDKTDKTNGNDEEILEGGEYEDNNESPGKIGKNQVGVLNAAGANDPEGPGEDQSIHRMQSGLVLRNNSINEQYLNPFDLADDDNKIGYYLIFELKERLFKFRGTQMPAG